MTTPSISNSSAPFTQEELIYKTPTKEAFLSLISEATKVDHQRYTEKHLTPYNFSTNAVLPGILQLILAPYNIIKNLRAYSKEKLKHISVSLPASKWNLFSHFLQFTNAALLPLVYCSTLGLYAVNILLLLPLLFTIGLVLSSIELGINVHNLYRQLKFLKTADASILETLAKAKTITNKNSFSRTLDVVIKKLIHLPHDDRLFNDKQDVITKLNGLKQSFKDDPSMTLEQAKASLDDLSVPITKLSIEHILMAIDQKYLAISPRMQKTIQEKSAHYYDQHKYPEALQKGLGFVQNIFAEKKILLANRVQPRLALQIINTKDDIINSLHSDNPDEVIKGLKVGLELIERIHYNAKLKKEVYLTNIGLFLLTITSYVINTFIPGITLIPILFFLISTTVYYCNHFLIYGYLDSKTYSPDFKNCLPDWLVTGVFKLHKKLFSTQKPPHPFSATNISKEISTT